MNKDSREIELVISHDVKTGKTTYCDYRFKDIKNAVLHAQGGSGGGGSVKPPLTDEEIDALLPEPDATVDIEGREVEVRPGVWGVECSLDDAWSKPLVIEIIRAVEKHYGIGEKK